MKYLVLWHCQESRTAVQGAQSTASGGSDGASTVPQFSRCNKMFGFPPVPCDVKRLHSQDNFLVFKWMLNVDSECQEVQLLRAVKQ
jgi:hypothetical protein